MIDKRGSTNHSLDWKWPASEWPFLSWVWSLYHHLSKQEKLALRLLLRKKEEKGIRASLLWSSSFLPFCMASRPSMTSLQHSPKPSPPPPCQSVSTSLSSSASIQVPAFLPFFFYLYHVSPLSIHAYITPSYPSSINPRLPDKSYSYLLVFFYYLFLSISVSMRWIRKSKQELTSPCTLHAVRHGKY